MMPEIQILRHSEISTLRWHEVLKLRSEAFVVEQICVYLDPDDLDKEAYHLLLVKEDRLEGYARLYEKEGWHLGRVVVAQTSRQHGYGKAMMEAALAWWKQNNKGKGIELSAQVYLSDYYQSFGFTIVGGMYLEDGIPHVRMCLE